MGTRRRYSLDLFVLLALTVFFGVRASQSNASVRGHKYDVNFCKLQFGLRRLPVKASVPTHVDFNQPQVGRTIDDIIFNYRAGQSTSSLLSKSLFVFNQALNIGTGALVGSGFLGSWVASYIICKLQKLVMSVDTNTSDATSLFNTKWGLTIVSCGVYFVVKCRDIFATIFSRNTIGVLSVASDLGVLLSIWMYSNIADPIVGGLIGCSYVSLELIASLIGSGTFVNVLSELRRFRLTPLDENGNMVNSLDNHMPSTLSAREALSHAISSVPLIATIPQYFLTLYLISSTIFQLVPKNNLKWFGGVLSWLQVGYTSNETGNIQPWTLSLRLFALHISVMAVKGAIASVLLR